MSKVWERTKTGLAILVSPIADKNPVKIWAYRAPVVLSAERIICIGAFVLWGYVVFRQPELLNGWPAATFGVFIVLALPITRALSRAPAEMALRFAETLVGRLGRGRGAQLIRGTSASAETPVLPEYEDDIDDLYSESDPAGLGHYEIGYTDRTAGAPAPTPAAPVATPEAPKVAESPPVMATPSLLDPAPKPDPRPSTEPATARPAPTIKAPSKAIDQPWPEDPAWLQAAFVERHVVEVEGPGSHPRILEYFRATSYKATDDAVPWCSAALCFVFEQAGVRSPRNAAARSWLGWGRSIPEPRRGAVAVLSRGSSPTSGHVTLVLAANAEHIWGYGGNQNNRWSVQKYPRSRVLPGGYRLPA
jgi:uncharacterized protein (TIGR02594 family)